MSLKLNPCHLTSAPLALQIFHHLLVCVCACLNTPAYLGSYCLFISTYNDIHMYDSGYYVEVKDDDDKNYYWKETDKDKEGWLKWVGR